MANQISTSSSPIPIPSHPKQYRAIGIVRGKYQPSVSAFTQGELISLTGEKFDTVLLGKTISAVKNHVDFSKNYHWIVYPHSTFQVNQPLHLQVTGIWQPQSEKEDNQPQNLTEDYFSIRGEVIFSSQQEEKVIVKIYLNNSIEGNKGKFFKLQLKGKIPNYTLKHFYDFDVILEQQQLMIKKYTDLGFIAIRYSGYSSFKKKNYSNRRSYQ